MHQLGRRNKKLRREHSNFNPDFKPDRNETAKLQVPVEIEHCDFWCDNFVITSGMFHSFWFSDKLQNHTEAGQSLSNMLQKK